MLDLAKKWVRKRPFGPWVAAAILAGFAWTLIWTAIEPLSVPDEISLKIARWLAHLLLAVIVGSFGAMGLALWARDRVIAIAPIPFDFRYTVAQSSEFYDRVAAQYDSRNSPPLLATHAKVVELVRQRVRQKPGLRVLDLGGGTGLGIARHFFDDENIFWKYVDHSAQMIGVFRKNFQSTKLNTQTEFSDIADYLNNTSESYDIIILSLVLTSLPYRPDWAKIASMLNSGGSLIVADIDAAYTALHPYYIIEVAGVRHGLEPDPVPMTQLIHEVRSSHLSLEHAYPIRDGIRNYSFVANFLKP